ncbi:MAG: hypothetical protein GY810_10085 [Aureispira sp.]|nr:hypothetical protein [Aureispira sp.]
MNTPLTIPLFPLNLFRLPGEVLQLHVYEPRYKELIEDVLNGTIDYFGIPAVFEYPDPMLGVLVSLETILEKHEDGTYDIEVKIVDLFELLNYQNQQKSKLYPCGDIKRLHFEPTLVKSPTIRRKILELSDKYNHLFRIHTSNATDIDILAELELEDDDKLDYILTPTQEERDQFLMYQLRKLELFLMQHKASSGNFNLN